MTYASLEAAYLGIQAQLNANDSVTMSLADFSITYVPIYLNKKTAGLAAIQKDVQEYLKASLDFKDDNAPAVAAQWNEQKSVDTSLMDTGTSAVDDLIENAKSEAQVNETDLQNAIASQQPINEYLKALLGVVSGLN